MSAERPIAIFLSNLGGGGVQRVLLNLARELSSDSRIDLVVARAGGELRGHCDARVRLVELAEPRIARAILPLAAYLRRERPRALLAAGDRCNLAALAARALARTDTRVVVSVHIAVAAHWRAATTLRDRLLRWLARRCYPAADGIATVSHAAAAELATELRLPLERITTIYNPVVTPALLAAARQPCPHPWLAAGEPPVVLAVGRLAAQKDFATLLAAFAMVRSQQPARLVVLGEGEERAALVAAARRLGVEDDVDFPGFAANPYSFMAAARCFVLSSAWEGLPTVLIEALAAGARVVATDCPTGPAEILAHGRVGRLTPVGDAGAMAAAILDLLRGDSPPAASFDASRYLPETSAASYRQLLCPPAAVPALIAGHAPRPRAVRAAPC